MVLEPITRKKRGLALGTPDHKVQNESLCRQHKHRVIEQGVRKEVSKREKIDHTYKTDMGLKMSLRSRNMQRSVCGANDHV